MRVAVRSATPKRLLRVGGASTNSGGVCGFAEMITMPACAVPVAGLTGELRRLCCDGFVTPTAFADVCGSPKATPVTNASANDNAANRKRMRESRLMFIVSPLGNVDACGEFWGGVLPCALIDAALSETFPDRPKLSSGQTKTRERLPFVRGVNRWR